MIQVRKAHKGEVTVLGKVTQKNGEGNGVRAAREPDEHAATGRTQAMPLNRPADPLMESSHQCRNQESGIRSQPWARPEAS